MEGKRTKENRLLFELVGRRDESLSFNPLRGFNLIGGRKKEREKERESISRTVVSTVLRGKGNRGN